MESPSYVKALLKPNGQKPAGRRVWSVDLETVWLPFFTATNIMGDTAIPHDALGAPLRLAYDGDGTVKFSKTGRPVIKVAKEVAENVKLVRENFVAGLMAYANGVAIENPDGLKAEVAANMKAGNPIVEHDKLALAKAIAATGVGEPIAVVAKAAKPKAKAKAQPEGEPAAQAQPEGEGAAQAQPEGEGAAQAQPVAVGAAV